jgi:hypothetical protein
MLALLAVCCVAGCTRDAFQSRGTIGSEGDRINNWRTKLEGCTRAPFDGLPIGQTRSILTFVWEDPGFRDPLMDRHLDHPDYPMRLEFSRGADGPTATLHTMRSSGIPLNPKVCTTFDLKTSEKPSATPEGRPSLSGQVQLECGVKQGHIVADLHFDNCRY